jgi:Ca2+-binding RTX toxin-like protein
MSRRRTSLAYMLAGVLIGSVWGGTSLLPAAQAGTPECGGSAEIWTGTSGSDTHSDDQDGHLRNNIWSGEAGGDWLYAMECPDSVQGKDGHDHIYMGEDNQSTVEDAHGGANNDTIYGEKGYDEIWGDGGDDTINENNPNNVGDVDTLHGGDGNDSLYMNDGDPYDDSTGGPGTDNCPGDPGDTRSGGC